MKKSLSLSIILLITVPTLGHAGTKDLAEGNKLYQEEKYSEAVEKYRSALQADPNSDIGNFNIGSAYYKAEQYPEAIESLRKSLLTDRDAVRIKAHYNLGNAHYKYGIGFENSDINQAIAELEEGLKHYNRSLEMAPNDPDAEHNREFLRQELERLKQKKEQQQNQQSQQNQQNQKNQENQKNQKRQSQDRQQNQQQKNQQDQKRDQQQDQNKNQPQDQQKGQPKDKKDDSQSGGGSSGLDQKSSNQAPSGVEGQKQDVNKKEALRMLEEYKLKEEPKGMLPLYKFERMKEPVYKDW